MALVPVQVLVNDAEFSRSLEATAVPRAERGLIPVSGEEGITSFQDVTVTGTLNAEGDVIVTGNISQGSGLRLGSSSFTVAAGDLTDGGGASGTFDASAPAAEIPVGAILFCAPRVTVEAGFAGDVSATIRIGDGVDPDRLHTGTPDVFATAATGIQMGVPSGDKNVTTAFFPQVVITSSSDIGLVITDDTGALTVNIPYLIPA